MVACYYTSGEFARKIGCSRQTLREWELKGLLAPHHKSPTGRRFYSQDQLDAYFSGVYGRDALSK